MTPKVAQIINSGMMQDSAISQIKPEYAYENKNIRILNSKDSAYLTVTNEKGNKLISIKGDAIGSSTIIIGSATISNYVVLFTLDEFPTSGQKDSIYRLELKDDTFVSKRVFNGELNFSVDYPIETVTRYESEDIQKVYWVDGLNQPRYINILADKEYNNNSFNFLQTLSLEEEVSVTKQYDASGLFTAGVIQYAFSYWNKYGSETKLFYTTPMHYVSLENRANDAEERVAVSFKIDIKNLDEYEFLRVYSIHRSSINATPLVKIVGDYPVTQSNSITVVDNGSTGETIDPTYLLYIGGENLIANTIAQKDNTLFLGGLKLGSDGQSFSSIRKLLQNTVDEMGSVHYTIEFQHDKQIVYPKRNNYYRYNNLLEKSSKEIKTFKGNEVYRFGIQFQDYTGTWTQPIFLKDIKNEYYPEMDDYFINVAQVKLELNKLFFEELESQNIDLTKYKNVRLVMVEPTSSDRSVICQGVVCPTVYSKEDRNNNISYAQSSWFMRAVYSKDDNIASRHQQAIKGAESKYGEIQCFFNSAKTTPQDFWNCEIKKDGQQYVFTAVSTNFSSSDDAWGKDANSDYRYKGDHLNFIDESMVEYRFSASTFQEVLHYILEKQNWLNTGIQYNILKNGTPYREGIKFTKTDNNGYQYTYFDSDGDEAQTYQEYKKTIHIVAASLNLKKESSKYQESNYIVDRQICTLHSPDINDETYAELNNASLNMRVVGYVPIEATYGSYNLTSSDSPRENSTEGLLINSNNIIYKTSDTQSALGIINAAVYSDSIWDTKEGEVLESPVVYYMYPWQRDFYNDYTNEEETMSGSINRKVLANNRISNITRYFNKNRRPQNYTWRDYEINSVQNNTKVIDSIKVFNSDQTDYIQIFDDSYEKLYRGNINSSITPKKEYPVYYNTQGMVIVGKDYSDYARKSTDKTFNNPIEIKYRSTPHAIIPFTHIPFPDINFDSNPQGNSTQVLKKVYLLKYSDNIDLSSYKEGDLLFLQTPDSIEGITWLGYIAKVFVEGSSKYYQIQQDYIANGEIIIGITNTVIGGTSWQDSKTFIYQIFNNTQLGMLTAWDTPYLSVTTTDIEEVKGYLPLVELYKNIDSAVLYGGNNEYAIENNKWIPIGEPVEINPEGTELYGTEGDTYFQRWDCLKTYSFSNEDTQSIIDITSFMVESRLNPDSRWDRNRGLLDNTFIDNTNFNLYNPVYNQSNNFFNYRILDEKFDKDNFYNDIVWSQNKSNNEDVDSWVNINLLSSLSFDGSKGKVTSLNVFNDTIYCLQEKGFSKINFNERVQIQPSDNTPIEITNSGKVDGYNYISDVIGCSNKGSIISTSSGLYFMNDHNNTLYMYGQGENGLALTPLSYSRGMKQWFADRAGRGQWTPNNINALRGYYDNINRSVYFNAGTNDCIEYNEELGAFTSFMPYSNIQTMFNLNSKMFTIKNAQIWSSWEGDYNRFYEVLQDYYVWHRVNGKSYTDKTFTNIEFRADLWDSDKLIDNETFDTLEVWNEYQSGQLDLQFIPGKPSNLKKKFRIWRADIPRDSKNKRDRIRNPWANIKLSKKGEDIYRMQLHDIMVYYYE